MGKKEKKKKLNGEILASIEVGRNQWNNPGNDQGRGKPPKGKLSCSDSCHTVASVELYRRGSVLFFEDGT